MLLAINYISDNSRLRKILNWFDLSLKPFINALKIAVTSFSFFLSLESQKFYTYSYFINFCEIKKQQITVCWDFSSNN